MQTFQVAFLVFLAFLSGVNCAVEISFASEDETESTADDFHCASSPCRNGGTCINGGHTYTCICPEFYGGQTCSENGACDIYGDRHCGNAECILEEQVDYNCTCEDVDPCSSDPCKNAGTCRYPVFPKGEHTCLCSATYSGKNSSEKLWCLVNGFSACGVRTCNYNVASLRVSCSCPSNEEFDEELKICKSACKPDPCIHGRCIEIGQHDFSCICSAKYTGKFCNVTVIDACTPNPCKNGGTCYRIGRDFACICKYFYSGITCEHGNVATITSLVVSLGVVALASVLCGLFCYKRNQKLKKMPKPAIHLAPLPATASEQVPRPAMASEYALRPAMASEHTPRSAMASEHAPRPAMASEHAPRPAMASQHAPRPAMASQHGQTNIYPTVPRF